ncbi:MAG: carbohydrate ABC transporter permease [Christensenellales bacterium]|nr:sugar ABC transporter permease [Clostridiales bacterium]
MTTASNKVKKSGGSWYYRLPFPRKMALWGIIFLIPWLLGFFLFFLTPMIQVVRYSFNEMSIVPRLELNYVGLQNYTQALQIDPNFNRILVNTLGEVLLLTPLVIVFSLLCAILLNGKFKGRAIARAIFFIPIIMATGLLLQRVTSMSAQLAGDTQNARVFGAGFVAELLFQLGIGRQMVSYLLNSVNNIFKVVSLSGIQILIFLSALQSISPALYEVAKIEGATGYETFWKVTVVMVSPMILTCTVYTLADLFLRSDVIDLMYSVAFRRSQFGLSAAMSVVYLIMCVLVIGIISSLVRRVVFYYD